MLFTKDVCCHQLGLRGVNAHTDSGGVAMDSFKQALCLAVATAVGYDVVGKGDVVGHMGIGHPWVIS